MKKCPDCKKEMQMYYVPRCFHCKKPEPITVTVYELFPMMYYLENHYSEFEQDKFWRFLCDNNDIRNDTYISLYLPETDSPEDLEEDLQKMIDIFKKEFPDYDSMLISVSW